MNYSANLLEFLESPKKRSSLIEVLLDQQINKNLFGGLELESILDNLTLQIENNKPLYNQWMQKVNGKNRYLSVPTQSLNIFIREYLRDFIKKREIYGGCHGGEIGWSVKKSLETHLPFENVLSFDLEKAFENVPLEKVYNFFYELLGDNLAFEEREAIADFFSNICTVDYSDKRGLPQGSPCSMILFNRILYSLDQLLSKKADEKGLTYSRWVDDITISSQNKQEIGYFFGAVELTAEQFPVSKQKVFFQENEAYLLGYRINKNNIMKNTKEQKLRDKVHPLDFNKFLGKNKIMSYDSWEDNI